MSRIPCKVCDQPEDATVHVGFSVIANWTPLRVIEAHNYMPIALTRTQKQEELVEHLAGWARVLANRSEPDLSGVLLAAHHEVEQLTGQYQRMRVKLWQQKKQLRQLNRSIRLSQQDRCRLTAENDNLKKIALDQHNRNQELLRDLLGSKPTV